ncbi:unnamed protein product [Cuscuta campestris]|uniref:Uncharacterized protein n=1 Tax=Cuscuta campestris TaxID=132261 RepID=A0A484NNN9_9ASTE|nr:unnamed protein product [Cuscuta campestris]
MVQTRSNVPTTSHVGGEENAPGSGNGTGGIGSTPDAVQALFGLGVTTEQLQAAVAALSAMGGNVPSAGAGKAPPGPHAEHAATSQHKGKKTRRSRRRPCKAPAIEEVIVEDVPEGEEDESSEGRVSAFRRLEGEETRVSAFDRLDRGPDGRMGDLRRQITEGRRRHAEESATSDARSARPERSGERRDERTQRRHSPTAPYSQPILRTVTLFTPRVMSIPLPANFRPWQIKAYNGTTDPQDHLSKFYASMEAAAAPDEVKCRCFLATLEGSACDWFNRLPMGTIDDWDTLAEKFLTHFAANRRQRLPYSHLLNICIRKGEKVRDFIVRWEKEARDVHGADDQALVAMFQAALPRGEVRKELRKNPPPTYQETLARAKFLASEEFDDAPDSEAAPAKRAPLDSGETAKKRKKKKDYTAGPRTPSAGVYSVGAPVGTGRELALSPLPHAEAYAVTSGAKYCEYHRNNTHNTKECFTLQKEMQRLIARGPPPRDDAATPSWGPPEGRTWRKPTEPVAVAAHARNPEKRHIGRECDDLDEDEAQGYPVGFIHGGNIGGDSVAQRKRWKHMAFVAKVHQAPVPKLGRREQIQFTEKDLPNTPSPHWDALVVKMEINNAIVHRTLVDTGSSVNIMYEKTFQDLGLDRKDLKPMRTPLSGFTGDSIEAERVITVPVIIGDGAHKARLKMEFMAVSINCVHNMILGRPGLEDLECVISPYYLCMKFPTPSGIGVARGDQRLARSCYVRITKKLPRDETLVVNAQEEMRKMEARPKAEPAEGVEEVPLDPRAPERRVKIGASLMGSQRKRLVDVLAAYRVIFAWGPGDMPGVDPKIICHRLAVNPESRPVLSQQPIGALLRSPNAPSRMSKWAVFLGAFQIEFKPRPAIKGQALADFVVECTAREEPSPALETDDWWTVFTDGSSAAKNSGGGVVVIAPEGFRAYYSVRFGFKASNNEAQYEALLCGLRLAAGMNATKLRIKCDSKLVVGHVSGEFEAKDERMKKYRDTALELLKSFTAYSVEQIPRAENAEADILSKLSSDTPEHIRRMANVEELSKPSIQAFPVAMICDRPRDWTDDIVAFLKDGVLPDDAVKAKLVRTRAPGHLLRPPRSVRGVKEDNPPRILLARDCEGLRGVCEEMQGLPRVPEGTREAFNKLYPHQHSYSVRTMGVDLVGALPRGTGSVRYVIVAIDYFTKWVEAAPLASITGAQCQKFLAKQVICRFGVPEHIITDNGTQFESKPFNAFLESWGIKHNYASVGYPQTNGQVENANRTIIDGLKRKLEACGGEWTEELPYILWTYRTTPRRANGETPFALCYGFEARAPAEISIATHREEIFDPERNEEALAAELHLVHERREAAFIRAENYRRKVKSYHDGRVHARGFTEGDWVLRKRSVSRPLEGGKFAKYYEGPYIIKEVVGPSMFRL